MNKKILLILSLCLTLSLCKRDKEANGDSAPIKYDVVPVEFYGGYCYTENNMNCHTFHIDSTSVWDEAQGGCQKVKSVIQTGDSYEILCEPIEHSVDVIIKKLDDRKISVQFGKESPQILEKSKQ